MLRIAKDRRLKALDWGGRAVEERVRHALGLNSTAPVEAEAAKPGMPR